MKYSEYVRMVDQHYPTLNLGVVTVSPPEALKMVAVECFMNNDITSKVATVTKQHLSALHTHGETNFEGKLGEGKIFSTKEKSGYKNSEFI